VHWFAKSDFLNPSSVSRFQSWIQIFIGQEGQENKKNKYITLHKIIYLFSIKYNQGLIIILISVSIIKEN